jgi:hypothetical protein
LTSSKFLCFEVSKRSTLRQLRSVGEIPCQRSTGARERDADHSKVISALSSRSIER